MAVSEGTDVAGGTLKSGRNPGSHAVAAHAFFLQSRRTASVNCFVNLAEHNGSAIQGSTEFPWELLPVPRHLINERSNGLPTWMLAVLAFAHAFALDSASALARALACARGLYREDLGNTPRVLSMGRVRVELRPHFVQGPDSCLRPGAQGASAIRLPGRSHLTRLVFESHGLRKGMDDRSKCDGDGPRDKCESLRNP